MATLIDAATFALDPDALGPIIAATERAAIAVLYEAPNTAGHENRAALAREFVANPPVIAQRMLWAVSTNDTTVGLWIAGDHDGAIDTFQFVVNSMWDALAGN